MKKSDDVNADLRLSLTDKYSILSFLCRMCEQNLNML